MALAVSPVQTCARLGIDLVVWREALAVRGRRVHGAWDPLLRRIELFGCNAARRDVDIVYTFAHELGHVAAAGSGRPAESQWHTTGWRPLPHPADWEPVPHADGPKSATQSTASISDSGAVAGRLGTAEADAHALACSYVGALGSAQVASLAAALRSAARSRTQVDSSVFNNVGPLTLPA